MNSIEFIAKSSGNKKPQGGTIGGFRKIEALNNRAKSDPKKYDERSEASANRGMRGFASLAADALTRVSRFGGLS